MFISFPEIKQIKENQCYGGKMLKSSVKMREEMSTDDVEDIIMGMGPGYKFNDGNSPFNMDRPKARPSQFWKT